MSPMDDKAPSLPEWKELYTAAVELKKIEPWTWMYDSDIFGVLNPGSGEIGYCCIMGALGEVFAMALYPGTEGLGSYRKLQSGRISEEEAAFTQKCLMASFEDREFLHPRDLQIIKELGLKFRGRNAWVRFRNYEPRYYPWFLTMEDARFLKVALKQAREVALMVKYDKNTLGAALKGHHLVRVPRKEGDRLAWDTAYLKPRPPAKKPPQKPSTEPLDELRLQRLGKKPHRPGMIWEVDLFMAPMAISDGKERPYIPRVSLIVDQHSTFIFGTHVFPPHSDSAEFLNQLYDVFESSDILPEHLWTSTSEVMELIEPICAKLGIVPKLVKRLRAVEAAKSSLFDHLSRR